MNQKIECELNQLKQQMLASKLAPSGPIVADGQSHDYPVTVNGITKIAAYTAIPCPFEDDPNGPDLMAWYGFKDKKKQYNYPPLIN